MNTDINVIARPELKQLEALRESILNELSPRLAGKRVAYLDMPIHLNFGDLLIEKGTYHFFNEVNVDLWNRVSLLDQKRLFHQHIPLDVILVLHGGGNFGDIYPYHQDFRLKVVDAFPDHQIIMLPQSIHFNEEDTFKAQSGIINRHSNLKLYARDQYSYDFLTRGIDAEKVGLLPDMAMMLLGSWDWKKKQEDKTLIFRRKDAESMVGAQEGSFDWRDLVSRHDRKNYRLLKRLFKLQNQFCCDLGAHALWPRFRDGMIEKAVFHCRQYGCIDTDRLHGFILAQLLGIPAICRDNSYGKIARYTQAWL